MRTRTQTWEQDEFTRPSCKGDFDQDGDVDGSDLALFAADFGRTIVDNIMA